MVRNRGSWFGSAVFLIACACGRAQPVATTTAGQEVLTTGQIYGTGLPPKTVVLTYDDGPDEHTLELAHYLHDNGVRATFFVNGRRFCKTVDATGACTGPGETRACDNGQSQAAVAAPKYYAESVIDEVLALGHRVGNHTQDHCHLRAQKSVANLEWEFKTTQDILDKHICDQVYLFRAPYGEWDGGVVGRINAAMGFNKIVGPINWDVDGEDWDCWHKNLKPEDCARKYLNILNGKPNKNGIFLMHDRPEFNVGYEGPLLMAKVIVPMLKAGGFKFATLDDVLKLTPNPAGAGCPHNAPADAGAADAAVATDARAPADAGSGTGGGGGGKGPGNAGSGSGGAAIDPDGAGGTSGSGAGPSTGAGGSAGAAAASGGASGAGSGGAGMGRPPSGPSSAAGNAAPGGDVPGQEAGGCHMGAGRPRGPAASLSLLGACAGLALARRRRRPTDRR